MQPLLVDGRHAHVVGMRWPVGYKGEAVGAGAHDLSPMALAPNANIQGTMSFVCQLRAGRLSTPRPLTSEAPAPLPAISSTEDRAAHARSDRNAD